MTDDEQTPAPRRTTADLLADIPLFAELGHDLREQVAQAADLVRLPAGEVLFRHGEPGDALYTVGSGRLEVVGPAGTMISVLGRGAAVGELALLTGEPRTATVRAVRDSELIRLGRSSFTTLLESDARFTAALTTLLGQRLAGTVEPRPTTELRNVVSIVALSAQIPIRELATRFHRTVAAWSRVGTLSPNLLNGNDVAVLGPALDRCEQANDVVLLAAGPDDEPAWVDFCLRQADRVLVIADAGSPPSRPSDARLVGCDLAFWSPAPPPAAASRPWLDELRPRARHWIMEGSASDAHLARAARRMFGRSIGIALSGGGARGLAHVGVVSALHDAGIQIDRFGGTSMGAFVAALFASGRSTEEVTDVLRRETAERRPFADYTVPRRALIRSHRARRMFRRVFDDLQLEELPYDCFGITADLITAETLVHRRGPIRHVVSASMSLPGLAPPLPWAGRLLVDGGVVNNLPVDVMADTGEGPVIGVEVMRRWQQEWEERVLAARTGSGTRSRRGRGRASAVPVPSMVETLSCSIGLGSRTSLEAARQRAWFTVTPELPDLGLLDWGRLDDAVAEGRRAAGETLRGIEGFA